MSAERVEPGRPGGSPASCPQVPAQAGAQLPQAAAAARAPVQHTPSCAPRGSTRAKRNRWSITIPSSGQGTAPASRAHPTTGRECGKQEVHSAASAGRCGNDLPNHTDSGEPGERSWLVSDTGPGWGRGPTPAHHRAQGPHRQRRR